MPGWQFSAPQIRCDLYQGSGPSLDLRPYLTRVTLNKDLSETPGAWEAVCQYVIDRSGPDLANTVFPNDYVEISMATRPGSPAYQMRGFVDNVTYDEEAASDGVTRYVTINGRDYGKLPVQYQIVASESPTDYARNLSGDILYSWLQDVDINANRSSGVNDFFQTIARGLQKKHLNLLQVYNSHIKPLAVSCTVPPYFGTDINGLATYNGTLDDLLLSQASPPWGEYFIRDDPDGPRLYFRLAPFISAAGTYPWREASYSDIRFVGINSEDVLSLSLTRSDNEVYTWFTTVPAGGGFGLLGDGTVGVGIKGRGDTQNPYWDGANNQKKQERARRFGFRPYEVQSPWMPGQRGFDHFVADLQQDAHFYDLSAHMNIWMVNTLGHAENLRSGQVKCQGVPADRDGCARVGDYIYLAYTGEYLYVQGLTCEWTEGSLTTVYQGVRGQAGNHEDSTARTPVSGPLAIAPLNPALDVSDLSGWSR